MSTTKTAKLTFAPSTINIMEVEWKGKVLLITGASRGIGSHVIRLALEEGVRQVVNLDIDEENGVALQNELNEKYGDNKVTFIKCDVTNEEQLKSNFETVLGNKSNNCVVINNAGILNDSLKTYKKEIAINVTALITGSLTALELMRKDKGGNGGTIINISSVVAMTPLPYTPIYNATKSAVLVFSIGIGADEYYKRTDVRVLTICFGATDTGLIAIENMGAFDEEIHKQLHVPLEKYPGQRVDSAARAVIDMFKQGESASVWLSNADRPVENVTEVIDKAYGIMAEPIFR